MPLVMQHAMLGVCDRTMPQVTNQGVKRRKRPGAPNPTHRPVPNNLRTVPEALVIGAVIPSSTTLKTKALILGENPKFKL